MDDLTEWLESHGLGGLAGVMVENDIDLGLLPQLTEQDFKELGLTIGQRRRLLNALASDFGGAAPPVSAPAAASLETRPAVPTDGPENRAAAERRQLTVLFCDLVGSTELSRQLDAEEVRSLTQAYQDAVAGVITRYEGHVGKYLGDGVLAYFGWPVAYEDQAERAVRAALDLGDAVGAIATPDGTRLAVRAGIASGEVVIGDLVNVTGTEPGAVSGATPNLAARLQSVADPGEVVISDETRRLVGTAFEVVYRGEETLKGFSEPVRRYAVSRPREVESRFEATRGSAISALVGRVQEIGLLTDRWAQAWSGNGTVVLLSGEAGIGKSRLVEALAEQVAGNAAHVVRLQCSPYFVNSAFHPVVERIRRAAGLTEGDDARAQIDKLRAMLCRDGGDPETALPVYERLLSIERTPDEGDASPAPAEIKEQTLAVLTERPVQLALQGPVLLIVEDVHWIDPSTLELLERLMPRIVELPILMVVTHRPDWSTDWNGLFGHVTALTVGRLDHGQIAELMQGVLGEAPSDELVADIARRTDGVPLFVEEFCQAIAEQRGVGEAGEVTVPASLQGSLMARLDRLPKAAKSLALIASVIGREFDASLLGRAAGISGPDLDEALATLRRMQVVFASGISPGAFVFRHALIRDTAYQSLLSGVRRRHHGAVARALETHHAEIVAREPELVAYHYGAAGESEAALPYWIHASERALARSATFEAVSHARQAFQIAKGSGKGEVEARIVLGRALESAGQIGTANQTLREAIDLARRLDDKRLFAEAVLAFANTLFLSLEPPGEALGPLEEALERLSPKSGVVISQILSHLVRGSVLAGDRARTRKYRPRAIDAARACGDNVSLHGIQVATYVAPVVRREPEEIADWQIKVDEMLETANQINDDTKGRTRSIATYVAAEMGDRDRMEQALASLKEVGAARQHMHIAWVARHGDAMCAILDGRFGEAELLATEALELGRQTHGDQVEGVYGIQMFTIRREQGRLAEVAPVVKKLIDADDPGAQAWKPGFAVIASDLGFEAPARRILDEMAEGGFGHELDAKYSTTLTYLADVATVLGDERHCEALYDLLLPYRRLTITAGVTTVCLGAAARHLGRLATVLGDWERAEDHFRDALELDTGMRAPPWLAHDRYGLAEMLERRGSPGDTGEIAHLRQQVLEASSALGMVALQKKCQRYLQ